MKYFLFALVFLVLSCKKDPSLIDPEPVTYAPVKRDKGISLGAGVTKTLGPAGGFLELGDQVLLEVPAGAVEENLQFSIEPITNTHDTASGRTAYRFNPEGVTFKKPVKITFKRDPLDASNPQTRRIAFQRQDGVWCGVSTELDNTTQQVSTTTAHFSDWVWLDQVTLRKDRETVGSAGEVKLKLMEQFLAALDGNNDVDTVPLAALDDIGRSSDLVIKGWKIVSGPGEITPKVNSNMVMGDAVYYAPHTISRAEEVEIQVEVESKNGYVSDPKAPNGRRKFGRLILLTKVRLVKDTYFTLTVGGKVVDLSAGLGGAIAGGNITVGSVDETGNHQVTLSCFGMEKGEYPGGRGAGNSYLGLALVENGTSKIFYNVYLDCTGEYQASGTTRISSTAGYITGTYSGPVYYSNKECGITEKRDVQIDFKIKSH
jgi:hypothetical protein